MSTVEWVEMDMPRWVEVTMEVPMETVDVARCPIEWLSFD